MEKRFDPMTGEPIEQKPEARFDPMTGKPLHPQHKAPKNKSRKGLAILLSVVLILAVAGGGVFAVLKSGIFLSSSQKVWAAVANTVLDQGYFLETLQKVKLPGSKYTMNVEADIEGVDVKAEFASSKKQKQLSGTISEAGGMDLDMLLNLDDEELKLQVPALTDKVLVYNYKEAVKGYLLEAGEEGEQALDLINQGLEMLYAGGEQDENVYEEVLQKLGKELIKEGKNLEFEKVPAETFEVDGKDVECKGYQTILEYENISRVVDAVEELMAENYEALFGGMLEESIDISYEEVMDVLYEIREEYREMPDCIVTFYLKSGKLACVRMECEEETAELLFQGGDHRMQNMKLIANGETLFRAEGGDKKSELTIEWWMDGYERITLLYENETYMISSSEGHLRLTGTLKADKKGWELTLGNSVIEGDLYDTYMMISMKEGASFKKISGETFDIGSASEEAFEELEEEITNAMWGQFY